MTEVHKHKIACPECGKEQEVKVWDSMNVTLDPDLRRRLFEGEINTFKCDGCSFESFLPAPLMYHDMTRRYVVQFYPPSAIGETQFLDLFNADGTPRPPELPEKMQAALPPYLRTPHIVFDPQAMLTYIEFRDRLSDHYGKAETPPMEV
jgi:hypothetical protein